MAKTVYCSYLPLSTIVEISEKDDIELMHNLLEQRDLAFEEIIINEHIDPHYEASFLTEASYKFSDRNKEKLNKNSFIDDTNKKFHFTIQKGTSSDELVPEKYATKSESISIPFVMEPTILTSETETFPVEKSQFKKKEI